MNFICIFSLINRWFNILNIINPLENNMKTISCWFNNIAIRKKNEMKIIVINLRLFDLPEWKFNNGNLGYSIFVTIKNDELIIMGNNKWGCEYSGEINLIFSI